MITVDGVAPYAKIITQKERRYKAQKKFDQRVSYLKLSGVDAKGKNLSVLITPGTQFMYDLGKKIEEFLGNKVKTDK